MNNNKVTKQLSQIRLELDELFDLVDGMHDSDTGIRELTLKRLLSLIKVANWRESRNSPENEKS